MFTADFRGAMSRLGALACALLITACGGGGMGSPPTANGPQPSSTCGDCGLVYLALTDADGDFMSYTVDVTSLKLERANGATVETLPATTRIDFAQYVDRKSVV